MIVLCCRDFREVRHHSYFDARILIFKSALGAGKVTWRNRNTNMKIQELDPNKRASHRTRGKADIQIFLLKFFPPPRISFPFFFWLYRLCRQGCLTWDTRHQNSRTEGLMSKCEVWGLKLLKYEALSCWTWDTRHQNSKTEGLRSFLIRMQHGTIALSVCLETPITITIWRPQTS
jgi:hypothetical protein